MTARAVRENDKSHSHHHTPKYHHPFIKSSHYPLPVNFLNRRKEMITVWLQRALHTEIDFFFFLNNRRNSLRREGTDITFQLVCTVTGVEL